jgi:hypothetical protein
MATKGETKMENLTLAQLHAMMPVIETDFLANLKAGERFAIMGDENGYYGTCKVIRRRSSGGKIVVEPGGEYANRVQAKGGINSYQRWDNMLVVRVA